MATELLKRGVLKVSCIEKFDIVSIDVMVIVCDSFEGCGKLIGGTVIGDFVDKVFKVNVSGFLKFSFGVGVNPDEGCLLIVHNQCIGD